MLLDRLTYVACPSCERLLEDGGDLDLQAYELTACPKCGASGEARLVWPTASLIALDIVDREPEGEFGEVVAVHCVFLAAALEAMIQWTLATGLRRSMAPGVIVEALMSRVTGRQRSLSLYKELVGRSAKQVLAEAAGGEWFDAWNEVVAARNRIAHGGVAGIDSQVLATAREDAMPSLARLHNALMDAIDKHTAGS